MGCNCSHTSGSCTEKKKMEYVPAGISFALLIVGLLLNHWELFAWTGSALIWYTIAYLPVGLPVLREAFEGLRKGAFFSEFTLMSMATIGAFAIGEYPEGVAVMLFYSIGEAFQERAAGNARRSIKALLDVRPKVVTVLRNGGAISIHPETVEVGETIEIKTGERVPLDGLLQEEAATFNTSALTGESVPRTIRKGEIVLAGMIVTNQTIRLLVSKPFEESALARILALVQEANERKAPAELFIRRFARIYTPIVTALAVAIVLFPFLYSFINLGFDYLFNDWLYRGLVFLVISCPCALVVSIPLGYFGGIGAASRAGILFKGGNYLDAITKINTVVFDKTGTLTKGVFEVQRVQCNEIAKEELLLFIASAERESTHPIARAIIEYTIKKNITPPFATRLEEIPGFGLKATVNGKEVLVGSPRLLSRQGIDSPPELSMAVETLVACSIDGKYRGHLLLSDTPKEDAITAIKELKALNIHNIQILSGDKQAIVSKLGEHLGVTHAYGDLLPEAKVAHIEILKRQPAHHVAFVGDGINDAPVLATSHIGIAMGGFGSDAAIETADIVLQNDLPSKVATAILIGKATRRIVYENIALAFGVKLMVLSLGAIGVATLWEAVFADVGVALLAILNAIRIQKKNF